MSKTIFILGRQPIFGLAELKSLLPNTTINTICSDIVSIDEHIDPMIIQRLGGVIKIAQVISTAEDSDDPTVEKIVLNDIKNSLNIISGKKFNFGISCYNTDLKTNTISSLAMKLKKILKKELISARMILSKETQLSIAQVIHNKLTKENGLELLIIGARSGLIFAQTTAISDINAYSSRDYERPYRDPKNGMLPPKLAQIMINLLNPLRDATILDPFCGSGVILQESLLMDFSAIGTDINSKMVLYSEKNLNWLKEKFGINNKFKVYKADATENIWQDKFDFIVSEIYLGKPFRNTPSLKQINQEKDTINNLLLSFLNNIKNQIRSDTKLCLAVPVWKYNNSFIKLPVVDHLLEIGYNTMSFKNLDTNKLIYHRPNQVVARQLLLLTRK